ncbi:hypothetical protein FRC01_010984 [Tulasnella sp. 417]|nr:hypothetical protein FRC01_010984 [Tulasnella sp. 417]
MKLPSPKTILLAALATTGVLGYESVEDAGTLPNLSGKRAPINDAKPPSPPARIARTLAQSESTGTLSTIFPQGHALAGESLGLMEYYAPCHNNGSLAVLFFGISLNGKNILASSNHSATFSIQSPPSRSAATKPRLAMMGTFEIFGDNYPYGDELRKCYLKSHPDAWWTPGSHGEGVHGATWARFDPQTIYFVGGFGGAHYIGYIPIDLYRSAVPKTGSFERFRIEAEK